MVKKNLKMKKLVRDNIPEIIAKEGRVPKTTIIKNDCDYLCALNKKLVEEVNEFIDVVKTNNDDHIMEELADVLEVIEAICTLKKYSPDSTKELKLKKKQERGGFEKRIVLEVS